MPQDTQTNGQIDAQLFTEAIAIANVPTLLMVLVQLTGDLRWLEEPYRPQRGRGMGDNDSAGLPEGIQQEIREAALNAILAWRAGRPVAIPEPAADLRCRMLAWTMCEKVPHEYDRVIAAELLLEEQDNIKQLSVPAGFEVLIIGAGVSGLCVGVRLQQSGIPFKILEKKSTVGGIWRDNRYPGAGVDTPNHLYSYSFAPYDWTKYFALRDELHAYLEYVTDKFNLRPHIRFNTEVESLSYVASGQRWAIVVKDQKGHETLNANVVVSAVGIFNPVKMPDIKGLRSFAGPCFHTAEWPDHIDLNGKRVAMIGNGASAMQTGPAIQDIVQSLTIFQKSAHWVAPNEQFGKPIPEPLRFLMREVPLYRIWYRLRVGWTFGDRVHATLQKDPNWERPSLSLNKANDSHRAYFTQYIESEVGDRKDLLEKVVPTYPPFGKRMLMDNGWYRMLRKDNISLVSEPITEIQGNRVVTKDGQEFEADVLIVATGFDVLRFLTCFETRGRSGKRLREVWEDDNARAYLGVAIPDFPNFFCLYGPNLQAGHGGSYMFMAEMQVRYVMDVLKQMVTQRIGAVECRQDVHDAYNDRIDQAHEQMVWTHPGMETYYRNARGRVVVNSPFRNDHFYAMTRTADLDDFNVEMSRSASA